MRLKYKDFIVILTY